MTTPLPETHVGVYPAYVDGEPIVSVSVAVRLPDETPEFEFALTVAGALELVGRLIFALSRMDRGGAA